MKVSLLKTEGCGHGAETEGLLRDVIERLAPAASLEVTTLGSTGQPEMARFAGSPTILVEGVDLEPDAVPVSGLG